MKNLMHSTAIKCLLSVFACLMCECYILQKAKYLYMASIQYRFNESYCTGAILSKIHVLTAYDCVSKFNNDTKTWEDRPPYRMIVAVGIVDLFSDMKMGQVRFGKAIRKHERAQRPINDQWWTNLAIIEVQRPFHFKDFDANIAKPMDVLPPWQSFKLRSLLIFMSNSPPEDCYAVGWGFKMDNNSVPSSLLQEIPLVLKKICNYDFCTMEYCQLMYVDQPNICGQLDHRCGGFRGNLLICFGKVYGLASFPSVCREDKSREKTPTVFVRMDEGLAFIDEVIGKGSPVRPHEFPFYLLNVVIMIHFKRFRILAIRPKTYHLRVLSWLGDQRKCVNMCQKAILMEVHGTSLHLKLCNTIMVFIGQHLELTSTLTTY